MATDAEGDAHCRYLNDGVDFLLILLNLPTRAGEQGEQVGRPSYRFVTR